MSTEFWSQVFSIATQAFAIVTVGVVSYCSLGVFFLGWRRQRTMRRELKELRARFEASELDALETCAEGGRL
jgi:hypothetical protein